MAAQQPILEENCSYFYTITKKWISGMFILRENCFEFHGQELNDYNLLIPLSTICCIEKKQSSFIYASLVITIGSEKHWFSSFPSRDTVYNLLELFWRGSLLSKPYKVATPKSKKGDTSLGKELLGILHESESTLVNAANALVDQGRQLQESEMVLEDVNTDLTKAEKILKTFSFSSSILGIKQPKPPNVEEVKNPEVVRQKHYKVTYTFSKALKESWKKGTLVIADEIVLLDEHQNEKILINRDSLEKLQIITPWEFCLVYSANWASESCFIMCPQLSGLLKYLYSVPNLKNKIEFEEETVGNMPSCSSSFPSDFKSFSPLSEEYINTRYSFLNPNSAQMQTLTEEGVISDGDIEEISGVLNHLQVLASEVSREQKQQMDQINSIITDVEKTELRMKTDIKNIKKKT